MSRTVEAKAVISAADRTGNVFDKLAQKIKGVEKNAKALGNIKPPRFMGDFNAELQRLKLTEKELHGVRDRRQAFMDALRRERPRAEHYFRAQNDWMDREVAHWRKLKSGIDEAAVAHKRWRSTMVSAAGAVASRGMALAGGAYGAYRVGRAGIKAAAENQRESARDYSAGLSDAESKRLEAAALEGSLRYKSVDSQTMHAALRETTMSGRSIDNAISLTDTMGEMLTVLQSMKGKEKAVEELRRFMSSLDVLGRNMDPKQIRDLAMGFTKAAGVEGADFDLGRLLAMSKQLKSMGATVSDRFLMTTGVSLGRDMGDEKAGNAIAMAMRQEVQATKQAKVYGRKAGLRDKFGRFIDRNLKQSDPDLWEWKHVPGAMRRMKLDPSKNEDINTFFNSFYSNESARNFGSKVVTQGDQYRAQARAFGNASGLDAAHPLMRRDPFVAYEAVFAQLRTFAGQAPVMDAAAEGLNNLSAGISTLNDAVKPGGWLHDFGKEAKARWETTKKEFDTVQGWGRAVLDWDKSVTEWGKGLLDGGPGSNRLGTRRAADVPVSAWPSSAPAIPYWGGGSNATYAPAGINWHGLNPGAARLGTGRRFTPPSFPAPGVSESTVYGTGAPGDKAATTVTVDGVLKGEGKLLIEISAPSVLEVVRRAEAVLKMTGRVSNGPGGTGLSSPDAEAPRGDGFSGVY